MQIDQVAQICAVRSGVDNCVLEPQTDGGSRVGSSSSHQDDKLKKQAIKQPAKCPADEAVATTKCLEMEPA